MRHLKSNSGERPVDWMGAPIGQKQTLIDLLKYAWPKDRPDLRVKVLLALLSLIFAKIVTVATPFIYKAVVDWLTNAGAPRSADGYSLFALTLVPIMLVVAYGMARVLMIGFNSLRDALFISTGQNAVRVMANKTFQKLHSLSLRFHLEKKTGIVTDVIGRAISAIHLIIRLGVLNFIPTIIELIFVLGVLLIKFGPLYVLVTLLMVIAYVWVTVFISNWRIGIRRDMHLSSQEANARTVDSLLNYETVKYFANEPHEQERFDQSMAAYENAHIRSTQSLGVLNAGQAGVFTIGLTLLMYLAARDLAAGKATLGDFVMINALMIQLQIPLNSLGMVYREVLQGLIDVESMFSLLKQTPEIEDAPDAKPLKINQAKITFENVSFGYDADREILKKISFIVPAGKTIALVGPSGAGKSTISKLLYRFYDVTEGAIKIDGQDIRSVTQESLRCQVGIVPQDTVLFNDTIGYNLSYGKVGAPDRDVLKAAQLAHLDEFIASLPNGMETIVGERGLKVSGGEKQRIAIARTILKDPAILILDEATSALDSFTEKEIQRALKVILKGRTSLVIAHRLSTIVDADLILVLEAGEIVEQGHFDELIAKGGTFAHMWARQREADAARANLAELIKDKE